MAKLPFTNLYVNMIGYIKNSTIFGILKQMNSKNSNKSAEIKNAAQKSNAKISSISVQSQINNAESSGQNASDVEQSNTSYNQKVHSHNKPADFKKNNKIIKIASRKSRNKGRFSN